MPKLFITNVAQLSPQSVESMLLSDLNTISEAIKKNDYSVIERSNPQELADALVEITKILLRLNSSSQKEVEKSLRYFVFLLERHYSMIVATPAASSSSAIDPLQEIVERISENVGLVSVLFGDIELPERPFLPPDIERTITRWKTIPCPNPRRTAKTIEEGKIDFIKYDGKSSVRLQLEDEAGKSTSSVKVSALSSESETFYLNLIDFEYYKLGLMHADHLLPSQSMINRLKEMIEIMNYDSDFAAEVRGTHYFNEYFLDTTAGIVGNYWLYMAHHNSMENLWFLLASDNTGEGKLATDPIDWLESREIGKLYLRYLESQNKYIDKRYVLYKLSDGTSLKDSFKEWISKEHAPLIKVCQELAQSHSELRKDAISTIHEDSEKQLRSSATRKIGAIVHKHSVTKRKQIEDDDSNVLEDEDTSDSSVPSDRREEFGELLLRELEGDADFESEEKKPLKHGQEIAKKVKTSMYSDEKIEDQSDYHSDSFGV